MLETLLMTDQVLCVFVPKQLLAPLREEARRAGWDEGALSAFFLMDGDRPRRGIIRQSPGHGAHFHVRFRCPAGDAKCTD